MAKPFGQVVQDGKYVDVRHSNKNTQRWLTETLKQMAGEEGNPSRKWAAEVLKAAGVEVGA